MKPPRCRVCQSEHWGQVHVWNGEVAQPSELCRPKVVVDAPKPAQLVVDAVANVVVDRNRDRHAKTDARKEYLRLKQRESRKRRSRV